MISQNLRNKYKFKKTLNDISQEYILCVGKFNHYLGCNSPNEIIEIAQLYGNQNCIAEVNQNAKYLNCYFDFDLKDKKLTNDELLSVKQQLIQSIHQFDNLLNIQFFVKDASTQSQTSLHFINRLSFNNQPIYFRNKQQIDKFFKLLDLKKPFDVDAHKGFCLRTLHADKYNSANQLSGRPFKKSIISDLSNDIESLVCYCPNRQSAFYIDEYVNRQFVIKFVHSRGFEKDYTLDDVKKRQQDNHLSLQLTEQKCHNRQHVSNNCVCMLFENDIILKCHDDECRSLTQPILRQHNNLVITQVEQNIVETENPGHPKISQEQRNVMNVHNQINLTKEQTGSDVKQILQLEKSGFKALIKYPEHSGLDQQLRQLLGTNGIVQHTLSNGQVYEFAQSSKLQQALQKLGDKTYNHDQITQIVQIYNQYNININVQQNFYGNQEDNVSGRNLTELFDKCVEKSKTDGLCQLDAQVIQNLSDFVVKGAKVKCIINLIQFTQRNKFILCNKDLYYFNTSQNKWSNIDGVNIGLTQLKETISNFFLQIQQYLHFQDDKNSQKLSQKISDITMKQLENIPYSTYLHLLRIDDHYFDQYTNLIHFKNNTYDIEKHIFVRNSDQYFNTFALPYSISQNFSDYLEQKKYLDQIISDILPNEQCKLWFLSTIGQNLLSISKQKPIIFMKGFGHNGKSFIVQLIRSTLGQYCSIGSSSIFQQDTILDSNKATNAINDVIESRICYIEELSSNKINIEQLKALTGGGTIQTRRNFQDSHETEIKCQFYVSCNNLPNFGNNVDQAIKNRVIAIPFETEFVDNPQLPNQRKKINNIANITKQKVYLQAFMSMIIEYSKLDIQIPDEVKVYTNEINQAIDPYIEFFENYIEITNNKEDIIKKQQLCEQYQSFSNQKCSQTQPNNPIFQAFEKFLRNNNIDCNSIHKINGKTVRGYLRVRLIDQE